MKKILYLSCHSVLEYDELRLLKDIGYDVFTNDGYHRPSNPVTKKRPPLMYDDNLERLKRFYSMCDINSKTENVRPEQHNNLLTDEFIEEFDIIMIMHLPRFLQDNWEKIKHKTVIWRSIGQSNPQIENELKKYRDEGLKIIRYSPLEEQIHNYIGHDTIIRFGKYKEDFINYTGKINQVITFAQSASRRGMFCRYDLMKNISNDFNFKIFGPDNEKCDLRCGGEILYEEQLYQLSVNKVYFYTGTWPAPYTLNFIEALFAGIPIVAIGKKLANIIGESPYEIPSIIKCGETGFFSDDIVEIKKFIRNILNDSELKNKISDNAQKLAENMFGVSIIKEQWKAFIESL